MSDGSLRRAAILFLLLCMCSSVCVAIKERSLESVKLGIERADSLYREQQYIQALDVYISQLSFLRRNETDSLYLTVLSRIGTIYDNYEDVGRAFYYYEKILTDPNVSKYDDLYSKVLVKMVVGYFNSGEAAKARHYYGLQLAHPIKDRSLGGYYHYTNGGLVESLDGHHGRAVGMFRHALRHCDTEGMQPVFKVPVMMEMAASFGKMHRPDSVLRYLSSARDISEREGLDSYAADCYEQLYRFYKARGDSADAARYLELYSSTSDSVESRRSLDTASLRLLQNHDVEAREEIDSLNERIDLQVKTLVLFLVFCVALTAFAVYTHRQRRRLQASYKLLIEKSEEIFELEEQNVAQPTSEAVAPARSAPSNPLLERINGVLNDIDLISRPSFSLADLSREAGSNTKYVSALINEVYKKNFRTILNERRIREATRRLSDDARYGDCSIADIADSLGYSSSTVFINAFKKVIGMTPAVYRRYRRP